jgi:quinol monooxygenase YgiN
VSEPTSEAAPVDDDDTFEIAISNAAAALPAPPPSEPAAENHAARPAEGPALDETALVKTGNDPDAADVPTGPLPMFGATVLQQVRDFDAWRAAFDATSQARQRAGFVAQGVMRGVDDPHLVAVWLAVTDVAQAKAYFGDKALNERMSRAGAAGRPRVLLSSNLTAKMEPGRTGLHAAILRMRVNDVAAFKATVDAQAQDRAAAGIVGYALGQDVDDPSLAYLYLQSEDPARLRNYVFGKQTKQTWHDAGLQGNAILNLVKEEGLALCR